MFDIEKIRADFPILATTVHGQPLTYLDSGATAQKPLCVIEKEAEIYRAHNGNIHRGIHSLSERMTAMYESARETVRAFVNAEQSCEIIFTSGATAGINLVAYSFGERFIGAGDNVVVGEMEHHSNIVPWQMVCERRGAELRVLPFDDDGRLCVEQLDDLIDSRTRMVAVTQASNVLGTRPDIKFICDLAHSRGAVVLVDGCQGVVHGGVDVQDLGCDFYVFSGHKLYAPTGIGVLYGRRELLEQMPPFMGGGDMIASVSFSGTTYAQLPLKFEAGTSNYVGAVCLGAAIEYVARFDRAQVMAHETHLLEKATSELLSIEGVKIYGTQPDKCSIISFLVEGTHPMDVGLILDKQGVAIRTGTHCAEPVMQHFGVTGMCRASFAMYNNEQDVERFVFALQRAVKMLR